MSVESLYKSVYNQMGLEELSSNNKKSNNKANLDISFSPFYLIGIEYDLSLINGISYTYHFDLNGKIRKVETSSNKEIKISYENNNLSLPDLTEYK